jgi:hypothetical protein
MQHELRGERFEQRLPGARRGDQRQRLLVAHGERRRTDPLGRQPHRALRHRVVEVSMAHRGAIFERQARAAGLVDESPLGPGGGKAAAERHAPLRPALEGGAQ